MLWELVSGERVSMRNLRRLAYALHMLVMHSSTVWSCTHGRSNAHTGHAMSGTVQAKTYQSFNMALDRLVATLRKVQVMPSGGRVPQETCQAMQDLIDDCLESQPSRRPDATTLQQRLQGLWSDDHIFGNGLPTPADA